MSDKKWLKARVRDAEAQMQRMEHELDLMRGTLVRADGKPVTGGGGAATALWNASSIPEGAAGARQRAKEKQRRKKVAVLGHAEAEHLLLAAKTIREKERRSGQVRQVRLQQAAEEQVPYRAPIL